MQGPAEPCHPEQHLRGSKLLHPQAVCQQHGRVWRCCCWSRRPPACSLPNLPTRLHAQGWSRCDGRTYTQWCWQRCVLRALPLSAEGGSLHACSTLAHTSRSLVPACVCWPSAAGHQAPDGVHLYAEFVLRHMGRMAQTGSSRDRHACACMSSLCLQASRCRGRRSLPAAWVLD
jgi:hypothetical protein